MGSDMDDRHYVDVHNRVTHECMLMLLIYALVMKPTTMKTTVKCTFIDYTIHTYPQNTDRLVKIWRTMELV